MNMQPPPPPINVLATALVENRCRSSRSTSRDAGLSFRLTERLKEYHQKEDELNERFGREMEAKTKLQKVLQFSKD